MERTIRESEHVEDFHLEGPDRIWVLDSWRIGGITNEICFQETAETSRNVHEGELSPGVTLKARLGVPPQSDQFYILPRENPGERLIGMEGVGVFRPQAN